ncbi:MAG TPA: LPS export ABC transporter periplasmic protein LptC [Stellaceae bacterium]|jgi:lipopolysaccharide export system protein LptC|nr:LPS export ABC transporter periplasmic protein LptC [Stellaceae bacterium]
MSVPRDNLAGGEFFVPSERRAVVDRRYSRFVVLAKRVLPIIAVFMLLLVGVWPHLQTEIKRVQFTLPRLDPREAKDLRMVNAHYTGVDKQNRPFVITAEVARQEGGDDQLIAMEGPKGDLTTTSGSWLELSGYTGIYQPGMQLLDLFGNVQLFQDKGNEFHTDSAHIDMAKGTGQGDDPVEGQGPFGHVTGQGFRILDHGNTIVFTGHARLDLLPRGKDPAS